MKLKLTIALIFIVSICTAQNNSKTSNINHADVVNIGTGKTDTVGKKSVKKSTEKKPEWVFNPNGLVTFSVSVRAGLVDDYIFTIQQGGPEAMAESPKLTGRQITINKLAYVAVLDSINKKVANAYGLYLKTERDKFTADTLKKFHPRTDK